MRYGTDTLLSVWGELTASTSNIYTEAPTLSVEGSPSDVPKDPIVIVGEFTAVGHSETITSITIKAYKTSDNSLVYNVTKTDSFTGWSLTAPLVDWEVSTEYRFEVFGNSASYQSATTSVITTTRDSFVEPLDRFGDGSREMYLSLKDELLDVAGHTIAMNSDSPTDGSEALFLPNGGYNLTDSASFKVQLDNAELINFSFSFWAQNPFKDATMMFSGNGAKDYLIMMYLAEEIGKIFFHTQDVGYTISGHILPYGNDNAWHFYTLVADGDNGESKLYIDGAEQVTGDNSSIMKLLSNYELTIGTLIGTYKSQGNLSKISLWNRALTLAEHTTLYQDGEM